MSSKAAYKKGQFMNDSDRKLVWRTRNVKNLLETKVLTVTEERCVSPEGGEGDYVVLNAPDIVVAVPVLLLPEPHFVLVRQWRHGSKSVSAEFPGGVLDAGEAPEDGARRELREETGYAAGKLAALGSFSPNPALMNNRMHVFLAEKLADTGARYPDSDEFLSVAVEPVSAVCVRLGSPEYSHALMIAAAFLYLRAMKPYADFPQTFGF
jgi:8-oxo-dGTP pyrophosphatase MutT (NUDIX family)